MDMRAVSCHHEWWTPPPHPHAIAKSDHICLMLEYSGRGSFCDSSKTMSNTSCRYTSRFLRESFTTFAASSRSARERAARCVADKNSASIYQKKIVENQSVLIIEHFIRSYKQLRQIDQLPSPTRQKGLERPDSHRKLPCAYACKTRLGYGYRGRETIDLPGGYSELSYFAHVCRYLPGISYERFRLVTSCMRSFEMIVLDLVAHSELAGCLSRLQ